MTASVYIQGTWDFAKFGSASFTVTDSAGAHAPVVFSSGRYEPGSICQNVSTSPAISGFANALQTALNAMGPRVYTVGLAANRYTISVDSGTFSIVMNAVAAKLTGCGPGGFSAGPVTTLVPDYIPWLCITPTKPGLYNYIPPTRMAGTTKERRSDAGTIYRNAPTTIPRVAKWEHQFEPKDLVDRNYRDWYGGGANHHLYTWEDLWSDYGLGQMPIGISITNASDVTEEFAFSLVTPEYDESVLKRRAPSDDFRFTVVVKAQLWQTAVANESARAFSG